MVRTGQLVADTLGHRAEACAGAPSAAIYEQLLRTYREAFDEAMALCDAVRNDRTVPIDDELDAMRRVLDRRRLAVLTAERACALPTVAEAGV